MAEPNFANRTLYHGDNLDFLRGMNSETVHLIATDPPFNKGRDFHATSAATPASLASGGSFQDRWSWRDDVHEDWLEKIQKDSPEVWSVITTSKQVYGDDMAAFLCFMGVRLLEMRRVLRNDGSIYLHCDPTASHYLKLLMDAVFGRKSFGTEIIWQRTSAHPSARKWANTHDIILFYTKSESYTWNRQYQPPNENYVKTHYIYDDKKGKYRAADLTGAGTSSGVSGQPWRGFNPTEKGRHWAYVLDTLDSMDRDGLIHWPSKRGGWPAQKVYWDEAKKGRPVHSTWFDIPPVNSQAKERTGYPTQKPLALYERIIQASSKPDEIVLDPFCGCATTPIAAERLGRQWVGVDIWDEAYQRVLERLEQEGLAVPDADAQPGQQTLTLASIHYSTEPPTRTDEGDAAAPHLPTPTGRNRVRYTPPRQQHDRLITDIGPFCQGCGRDYGFDTRVLEVDHIRPKSDGGNDAYDNLTLLCPPCNKEKRDWYTLTRLQQLNRDNGHLLPENERNLRVGRASRPTRRARRR